MYAYHEARLRVVLGGEVLDGKSAGGQAVEIKTGKGDYSWC